MAFLEVENLSLTIDKAKLLEEISFSVEKNTITLIAGRNGSGKSLLLKCLKGLEKPDKGFCISLDGIAMPKSKDRMKAFGLVFQDTGLQIVGSTVERDIAFGPENQGKSREEIKDLTQHYLSFFSLEKTAKLNPGLLSGGEKRKLAIAGCLAMDNKILLLDEPFANLDYPSTLIVIETLLELKKNGMTILIVSHEAEKFLKHTDNTIIISNGRIVASGKSCEMMDKLRDNQIYLPKNAEFGDLSWL